MKSPCSNCKKEISEKESFIKAFGGGPAEIYCIDCVNSTFGPYKKLEGGPTVKSKKKLKAVW